jgi:NAD(P)H dehydrogenase (quinone)
MTPRLDPFAAAPAAMQSWLAWDKLGTLIQLAVFAAQHGMHWVNLGLTPARDDELNRFGFWLGAASQSIAGDGPPEADLATARHLGRRVAETAAQLARGRHT